MCRFAQKVQWLLTVGSKGDLTVLQSDLKFIRITPSK